MHWEEWPACDRIGAEYVADRTFERLRWMATRRIPARLHDSFFILYDEVEEHSSYVGYYPYRCKKHKKPRAGWLKVTLAWIAGWFWGTSERRCPPQRTADCCSPRPPFEWNTKC